MRNYHRCLSVLLEPLKECQTTNPPLLFRRGDEVAKYKILCPIAVVIGDNLSNDHLAGRVSNKTPSSMRMSRRCLTTFGGVCDLPHMCHPAPSQLIDKLCMGGLGCYHNFVVALLL